MRRACHGGGLAVDDVAAALHRATAPPHRPRTVRKQVTTCAVMLANSISAVQTGHVSLVSASGAAALCCAAASFAWMGWGMGLKGGGQDVVRCALSPLQEHCTALRTSTSRRLSNQECSRLMELCSDCNLWLFCCSSWVSGGGGKGGPRSWQ